MTAAEQRITLPAWAQVGEKRRAHIARVTALLDGWAESIAGGPDEARALHDVGVLHDALLTDSPTTAPTSAPMSSRGER